MAQISCRSMYSACTTLCHFSESCVQINKNGHKNCFDRSDMKYIKFALICFSMAIASVCYAQKKKVIKIKKPIYKALPKPPAVEKYSDSIKMIVDTVGIVAEPVMGSATIATDYSPPKAEKGNDGFNQYSNNRVFTDADVLLNKQMKKVDEADRVSQDALLIYGNNGSVVSFDLQKETVNWTYAEKDIKSSGANKFSVDHATVYLPYINGTVTALNVNTGSVNWRDKISLNAEKSILTRQDAVVDKGLLFIAARNSNIYAVNKIDGTLAWNYRLDFEFNIFAPIILNEGVYINNAPYVYKFEAQTGKAIWQRGFKWAMYAKMVTDGKRVYATNERNTLFALNPAGMSTIDWEFNLLDNQYGVDENVILNNGIIYLAGKVNPDSQASSVYAVNTADGKQIWKTDLPKGRITNFSLIDGQIYGYMKDNFFIIDAKNGKQVLLVKPLEEPLSNMIRENASTVLYISKNGLVRYSKAKKSFKLTPIAQLKTEDTDDNTTIQLVTKEN